MVHGRHLCKSHANSVLNKRKRGATAKRLVRRGSQRFAACEWQQGSQLCDERAQAESEGKRLCKRHVAELAERSCRLPRAPEDRLRRLRVLRRCRGKQSDPRRSMRPCDHTSCDNFAQVGRGHQRFCTSHGNVVTHMPLAFMSIDDYTDTAVEPYRLEACLRNARIADP